MIKRLISPIQAWVLVQGKCVGCGQSLKFAKAYERRDNTQQVVCKCKRTYIYDRRNGKYRRAIMSELKV